MIIIQNSGIHTTQGEIDYLWFDILDPAAKAGQAGRFFRAVALAELAAVPVSIREDYDLLQKQWAAVRGLYNAQADYVYTAAGIFTPQHVGVVQFYGGAGEAESRELAAEQAIRSLAAVKATLANYAQSRLAAPNPQWVEWYLDFVTRRSQNILALFGHPDPRETRRGLGKDGELANDTGDDLAAEQNELLFRGLAKLRQDFVFQVTSRRKSRAWLAAGLAHVARIAANLASRQRGSVSIGFNLSIPIAMALSSAASGGRSTSNSNAQSQAEGVSHGWGQAHTDSTSHTVSQSSTVGGSETHTVGTGSSQSVGHTTSQGQTTSQSHSDTWGHTNSQSHSESQSVTQSEGTATGHSTGQGSSSNWSQGESANWSQGASPGPIRRNIQQLVAGRKRQLVARQRATVPANPPPRAPRIHWAAASAAACPAWCRVRSTPPTAKGPPPPPAAGTAIPVLWAAAPLPRLAAAHPRPPAAARPRPWAAGPAVRRAGAALFPPATAAPRPAARPPPRAAPTPGARRTAGAGPTPTARLRALAPPTAPAAHQPEREHLDQLLLGGQPRHGRQLGQGRQHLPELGPVPHRRPEPRASPEPGCQQRLQRRLFERLVPGISINRSWQVEDDLLIRLTEIVRQYEALLNQASAEGAFLTSAVIFTADQTGSTAAQALVPQAFHGPNVPMPVFTIQPTGADALEFRDHALAFPALHRG